MEIAQATILWFHWGEIAKRHAESAKKAADEERATGALQDSMVSILAAACAIDGF